MIRATLSRSKDPDVQTELSMSLSYSYKVNALPLARPGMSPSALVNVSFPKPGVADCSIIAGKEIEKFPARRVPRPKSMRAANLSPRIVSINSKLTTANLCIKVTQQNAFFRHPQRPSVFLLDIAVTGECRNVRRKYSKPFSVRELQADTHHTRHTPTHARTHARTHACTHAHTHAQTTTIPFPFQTSQIKLVSKMTAYINTHKPCMYAYNVW